MESLPSDAIAPFLPGIWSLLCQRLQTSNTPKYTKHFLVFLALFIDKHGVQACSASLDQLQQGLFAMLLRQVLVPNFNNVKGDVESKLCAVALTKICCEWPDLLADQANWGQLLGTLVAYVEAGAVDRDDGGTAAWARSSPLGTLPPLPSSTTRRGRRRTRSRTSRTSGHTSR